MEFFIKQVWMRESRGGVLLFAAAVLALVLANSAFSGLHGDLLNTIAEIRIGTFVISKPLSLWINDGLMSLFFLQAGLEIKREVLKTSTRTYSFFAFSAMGALGGIVVPAIFYSVLNWGDDVAMKGWAIPTATDIAFTMGVLSLFGLRVPYQLRMFLLTLAVIDDLGAILIIALFYSEDLSFVSSVVSLGAFSILVLLNFHGVRRIAPYMVVGVILWAFLLKSGVHATLAGVLVAMTIPDLRTEEERRSPLRNLENSLYPWVAYCILPLFAFANSGLSFENISWGSLFSPVPFGIVLGLVIGKPLGIFSFSWLGARLGWVSLPAGLSWGHIFAVSILGGIGFTMSLFIGSLSFEFGGADFDADKLGVLVGSLISGVIGSIVLHKVLLRPLAELRKKEKALAIQ